MSEHLLDSLASIVILGVGAQWIAWRLGLPSILLLLMAGFIAGPVTGLLHPDALLGDLLFPVVSFAVAIILFEGGLSLRLNELRGTGHVVRNLVSIGALTTWAISTLAAVLIIGFTFELAALLGAILVVTGPTVIGPLLREIRPSSRIGAILKWEGIVIDPVGASLAVLVFEVVLASGPQAATAAVFEVVILTIVAGGALGALGAALIVVLMRRYWVPDFLQNPVVLTVVIGVFVGANLLQEESGLLAVTVMGVLLGNQRRVVVKHILDFKENLRVLMIASLFVLLTARLQLDSLASIGLNSLTFLAVIVLVARPAAVFVSTIGAGLKWSERLFLAWMAPRGIVAASVSSLFALRLAESGIPGARQLVPVTFLVIAGTVLIYSLTTIPLARWLNVSRPRPQGVMIAGAHKLAREIGFVLQKWGYDVVLVDTNHSNTEEARAMGLPTFYGSVLAEDLREDIVLSGIGRLLAITPNDEVNALAALEWAEVFGRAEVYQLIPEDIPTHDEKTVLPPLRGRPLFGIGVHCNYLMDRFNNGATIEVTTNVSEILSNYAARKPGDEDPIPLFVITDDGSLVMITAERPRTFRTGKLVISLTSKPELSSNPPAAWQEEHQHIETV